MKVEGVDVVVEGVASAESAEDVAVATFKSEIEGRDAEEDPSAEQLCAFLLVSYVNMARVAMI